MVGAREADHVDLEQRVRSPLAQLVGGVHGEMEVDHLAVAMVTIGVAIEVDVSPITDGAVAIALHGKVVTCQRVVGDLAGGAARLRDLREAQGVECLGDIGILHRRRQVDEADLVAQLAEEGKGREGARKAVHRMARGEGERGLAAPRKGFDRVGVGRKVHVARVLCAVRRGEGGSAEAVGTRFNREVQPRGGVF